MFGGDRVQMPIIDAPATSECSLVGLGVLTGEVVMVVVVVVSTDSVSPVTARAYVFETFEAVVRHIFTVELEVKVIRVGCRYVDERTVGAVRALRGVPA